jgi:branched-chain amino acid transport system permease protein
VTSVEGAAIVDTVGAPVSPRDLVVGFVKEHAEVVIIVLLVLGTLTLRDPRPGIYVLGITVGAGLALQSIGIVLVYRANRIINFAQVEIGALGGTLFSQLVTRRLPLKGLQTLCPPCVPEATLGRFSKLDYPASKELAARGIPPQIRDVPLSKLQGLQLPRGITTKDLALATAPGWMIQVSYWLSVAVSMAAVILISYVLYALIMRRFQSAPRLIATVVTIGLGQVFVLIAGVIVSLIGAGADEKDPPLIFPATIPIKWKIHVNPATFGTADILSVIIAVVVLAGLAVFFARSSVGVVLRGAAENPDRARTLGVNVSSVNGLVWMMAGALSGIASILLSAGSVGGGTNLVKYLAVAVFGGLVSIPITVVAAFAIGIVDQTVAWSIPTPGTIDGIILVIVVAVLLFQRARATRVDTEATGWNASREARPIPDELKDLPVVRKWVRISQIAGITAVLAVPWLFSPAQTNLAGVALIYGIVALSLLVLTGWAGQISLGHFAFAAIGAYVTAVLEWPFPLRLVAGGLVGAGVAVVIGLPALRLRGLMLAVPTLAFSVAVTSILLNPRYLGKALPAALKRPSIIGLDLNDQRTFYYFVLVFLALATLAVTGMRRSRIARALIASRENEAAAQAFGINLLRARLSAFAVSGFMAAFAGGLFAYSQNGVNLSSYDYKQSIKMFLMVVIGGTGSIAGPLVGALYVGFVDIVGPNIYILFASGATGVGVVVILLFAPGGLADVAFKIRDAMLRRVAERYRIEVPSLIADRKQQAGRAPIAEKTRPSGGAVFIPKRYRADGQWSVVQRKKAATGG